MQILIYFDTNSFISHVPRPKTYFISYVTINSKMRRTIHSNLLSFLYLPYIYHQHCLDPVPRLLISPTLPDSNSDMVLVDGLLRFFQEIHLDVYSIDALIFNWKLGAAEQGQWSREEYCNGLVSLG